MGTKIEILRTKDGSRVILKVPKTCQRVGDEAVAKIEKELAADPSLSFLGGFSCSSAPDSEDMAGVVVAVHQTMTPPSPSEFKRACGLPLKQRLAWVRKKFGESGKLEIEAAPCDAANERITLLGNGRTEGVDFARMTLLPSAKGVVLVNVMYRADGSQSVRAAFDAIADSTSVRLPPSSPASPAER